MSINSFKTTNLFVAGYKKDPVTQLVSSIDLYDGDGNINRLVIRNEKSNVIVYQMGEAVTEEEKAEKGFDDTRSSKITPTDVEALKKAFNKEEVVQNIFKHFSIEKWEDMTVEQMTELAKTINKKEKKK